MKNYMIHLFKMFFYDSEDIQDMIMELSCDLIDSEKIDNEIDDGDDLTELAEKEALKMENISKIITPTNIIDGLKDAYQNKPNNIMPKNYLETLSPAIEATYKKIAVFIFRVQHLNPERKKMIETILKYNISLNKNNEQELKQLLYLAEMPTEQLLEYLTFHHDYAFKLITNYFIGLLSNIKKTKNKSTLPTKEIIQEETSTILDKYDRLLLDVLDYSRQLYFEDSECNDFIAETLFQEITKTDIVHGYFEDTIQYKRYLHVYFEKLILDSYIFLYNKDIKHLTTLDGEVFNLAKKKLKENNYDLKNISQLILRELLNNHLEMKSIAKKELVFPNLGRKFSPLCYIDLIK